MKSGSYYSPSCRRISAILLLSVVTLAIAQQPKAVTVGWTGDGKTFFCNKFDNTRVWSAACIAIYTR